MIITPAQLDQRSALLDIAVATSLFGPEEADGLLGGVLDALAAKALPPGHDALTCVDPVSGRPFI